MYKRCFGSLLNYMKTLENIYNKNRFGLVAGVQSNSEDISLRVHWIVSSFKRGFFTHQEVD